MVVAVPAAPATAAPAKKLRRLSLVREVLTRHAGLPSLPAHIPILPANISGKRPVGAMLVQRQSGRYGLGTDQRPAAASEPEIAVPLRGGGAIGFAGSAFGGAPVLATVSGALPGSTTTRVPTCTRL